MLNVSNRLCKSGKLRKENNLLYNVDSTANTKNVKDKVEDKSFCYLRKEKHKTLAIRRVGGWIRIDIFLFSIYIVVFCPLA